MKEILNLFERQIKDRGYSFNRMIYYEFMDKRGKKESFTYSPANGDKKDNGRLIRIYLHHENGRAFVAAKITGHNGRFHPRVIIPDCKECGWVAHQGNGVSRLYLSQGIVGKTISELESQVDKAITHQEGFYLEPRYSLLN